MVLEASNCRQVCSELLNFWIREYGDDGHHYIVHIDKIENEK